MSSIDFSDFAVFLHTSFFIFLGIFGRYVGLAWLFQYLFKDKFKAQFQDREVNTRLRPATQAWREVGYSAVTSIIFALIATAMLIVWQKDYTRVYTNFGDYSVAWWVFSVLFVLFVHETYYYWLHRLMHHPLVYKYIHKAHHESITTSAWTSFSFHPTESVLQVLILPALCLIVPLHTTALAVILLTMTTTSVINHLNTELYPKDFDTHWFGKWWIGATHHSLHHSQFKYNFGLYFTFWDKLMDTESPQYHGLFNQKTQKKQ